MRYIVATMEISIPDSLHFVVDPDPGCRRHVLRFVRSIKARQISSSNQTMFEQNYAVFSDCFPERKIFTMQRI